MERDRPPVDLERDDPRDAERCQRPDRRMLEGPADRGREAGAVWPPVPAEVVQREGVVERTIELVRRPGDFEPPGGPPLRAAAAGAGSGFASSSSASRCRPPPSPT